MAVRPDFINHIEFNGPTWKALKMWMEDKKQTKIDLLIGAETHDKSNQIRGSLQFINEILALEKAAASGR